LVNEPFAVGAGGSGHKRPDELHDPEENKEAGYEGCCSGAERSQTQKAASARDRATPARSGFGGM